MINFWNDSTTNIILSKHFASLQSNFFVFYSRGTPLLQTERASECRRNVEESVSRSLCPEESRRWQILHFMSLCWFCVLWSKQDSITLCNLCEDVKAYSADQFISHIIIVLPWVDVYVSDVCPFDSV